MNSDLKIGIIGTGNMGSAIIKGIVKGISPSDIKVYDTDSEKLKTIKDETGVTAASGIDELLPDTDIIILAVKPAIIPSVAENLKNYDGIILSVAAGVSLDRLKKAAGEKKLIRAMPNTPALSGCGMTAISASDKVSNEEITSVIRLLEYTGRVLLLEEKHMNAVTGLSGSGPAYVFTFIQALADAGVKMGLTRSDSLLLAGQTIYGSAKMFLDKMENPIKLRDNVASPGGTTIEALHSLDRAGFNGIIIDAVESAFNRAKELEKTS
ncbi:MAG TPA: pyrroline-5-carboxylate reductase [Spirochaetota bacterium]|nr:pyrroline-5-carboxylate reductase [Spirochaetota bacterium]HPJ35227.1 pyrroline-5-carboxylate reductase [Spirochaetota bacterium]